MEIQVQNLSFDPIRDEDFPVDPAECRYDQPSASTDGVSFRAIPRLKRVATTTVMVLGTASIGCQPPDLRAFDHSALVLPSTLPDEMTTLAERYAKLREGIAASGIAMLDDERLREEIRDRRGLKPETEG